MSAQSLRRLIAERLERHDSAEVARSTVKGTFYDELDLLTFCADEGYLLGTDHRGYYVFRRAA